MDCVLTSVVPMLISSNSKGLEILARITVNRDKNS